MHGLKSWLLCLALLVWLPACPGPQSSCSKDSECGVEATCNVEVGVCVTCDVGACAAFQQCLRGACGARYQSITIVRPTGGVVSPVARLQAQLDLTDGAVRNDPPFLTYLIKDADGRDAGQGQLALLQSGLYEGIWNAGGSARYSMTVSYADAGLTSPPVEFTIDAQPPTVELSVPVPARRDDADPAKADERDLAPLFGAAWRRDEIVSVVVKASEPLDLGSSTVVLTAEGGGAALATPKSLAVSSGCGAPYCAVAAIDLAEPPMAAFRGTFGLSLAAADVAGNAAQALSAIRVTRQKWRFATVAGDSIRTTPVVGAKGNIYFATISGSDSIWAVTPSGTRAWGPIATGRSSPP